VLDAFGVRPFDPNPTVNPARTLFLLGSLALSALSLYILLSEQKEPATRKAGDCRVATTSLSGPAIRPHSIDIWIRDSS
jgi:hypothetical protein